MRLWIAAALLLCWLKCLFSFLVHQSIGRQYRYQSLWTVARLHHLYTHTDTSRNKYNTEVIPEQSNRIHAPSKIAAKPAPVSTFQLDDILDQEDLQLAQTRFKDMIAIFPTLNTSTLTTVATKYPVLLALEGEKLRCAKLKIDTVIPYVDIEYLLDQSSPGLELFLNCARDDFDLSIQLQKVREVTKIQDETSLRAFIRRVPHCLSTRYLSVMKDHIRILSLKYGINIDTSLDIASTWPGFLGVAKLEHELDRLEAKLSTMNITYDAKYLTKLIQANPRVIVQNVDKKFNSLMERYPSWNMQKCIRKNPRLLTMKMDVIDRRVKNMEVAFDGYDIDIYQMINSYPPILNGNFTKTIDSFLLLKRHLPSCSMNDLATKYIKLSQHGVSSTVRSIERMRKTFQDDIDAIGDEIITVTNVHKDAANKESIKFSPNPELLDVSQIVKECAGNKVVAAKKIVEISPELWWECEATHNDDDDDDDDGDGDINNNVNLMDSPSSITSSSLSVPQEGESRIAVARRLAAQWSRDEDFTGDVISTSTLGAKDTQYIDTSDKYAEDLRDATSIQGEIDDASQNFDVTRIVLGNVNIFSRNPGKFIGYVKTWVREYGAHISYEILNAQPSQLKQNPTAIVSQLKLIYTIAASCSQNDEDENTRLLSPTIFSLCSGGLSSPAQRRRYSILGDILMGSSSLKISHSNIQNRLDDILLWFLPMYKAYQLYEFNQTPVENIRGKMIWKAPKLLSEKSERIIIRILWLCRLLMKDFQPVVHTIAPFFPTAPPFIPKDGENVAEASLQEISKLFIETPRILGLPLSVYARLQFTFRIVSSLNSTCDEKEIFKRCTNTSNRNENSLQDWKLPISLVPILLDCNTSAYIQQLHDITSSAVFMPKELAFMYSIYLEQLRLDMSGKDDCCSEFATKLTGSITSNISLDFTVPFVDKIFLFLYEKHVFDCANRLENYVTNDELGGHVAEDSVNACIDSFIHELLDLARKLPNAAALLEMAEIKERKFCGEANEQVSQTCCTTC